MKKRLLCRLGIHKWISFTRITEVRVFGKYGRRRYTKLKCNYCDAEKWKHFWEVKDDEWYARNEEDEE